MERKPLKRHVNGQISPLLLSEYVDATAYHLKVDFQPLPRMNHPNF
jgi:hypothetical protein